MSSSFNLNELCNCPNPCPECCINSCGCTNLPTTFHTSWDGGTFCTGFTGFTNALTYNTGTSKWESNFTTCGSTYTMDVHCDVTGFWVINITTNTGLCSVTAAGIFASSAVCIPFELKFNVPVIPLGCSCCTAPQTIVITVTF